MKLEIDLYYYSFLSYSAGLQCQSSGCLSSDTDANTNKIKIKTVTVNIPDDLEISKREFDKAVHLSRLSEAERRVEIKRDELTNAEEVVKNMMAIEHTP